MIGECHGWDYLGKDGEYGSGSHRTGFQGILMAAQSKSTEELTAAMKSGDHDFTDTLSDLHIEHVVLFMKNGLIDMKKYIDYSTKKPVGGNVENGKKLFEIACWACHGEDGRHINFGDEEEPEYVATIAIDNPQEFMHKVRVGQPSSDPPMPSAIVSGWSIQDVVDVLAYSQTLSVEVTTEEPHDPAKHEDDSHGHSSSTAY
jgi:thiosulfate dehydrogenase